MLRVAVVDLGMGNLRSVQRALERAAADGGLALEVTITADPGAMSATDKIVFPGQGAFRDCAAALQGGIGEAIRARIASGTPNRGICLGRQAVFQSSEEAPGAAGLGVFAGAVKLLGPAEGIKIPHMGWNRLSILRPGAGALATFDVEPPHVYFVHSYHAVPEDASLVAAVTEHGPHRITAAVQRDNVVATQFHPEKSQGVGLRFLRAFLEG